MLQNSWKQCKHIDIGSRWFEVFEIGDDIVAIYEPYHFQEVISYLILGSERALLWDTGMGIHNIRDIVEQITDKPILVMNSHVHFDHVGDNHRFEQVLVHNTPTALARLEKGYSALEMNAQNEEKLYENPAQRPDVYEIPPCKPQHIEDGYRVDLGNRTLQVIHTPGHAPESIMLHEEERGILFTGDSYYPGYLYAHFSGPIYQESHIPTYAKSLEKACRIPGLKVIHPSHNEPIAPPSALSKAAAALRALADGTVKKTAPLKREQFYLGSLPEEDRDGVGYPCGDDLVVYEVDGVKVIARKQY